MLTGGWKVIRARTATAGMIAKATNKELINVALTTIGMVFRNWPMMPETSTMGKKAATVVNVPPMSGFLN